MATTAKSTKGRKGGDAAPVGSGSLTLPKGHTEQAVLRHLSPSGERVFVLGPTITSIGRDPANLVMLSDPAVSRRHASISRTPDGYMLVDLCSMHGTRVNGAAIASAMLHPGDEVVVGATRLRFEERVAPVAAAVEEEEAPPLPPLDVVPSLHIVDDTPSASASFLAGDERRLLALVQRIAAVADELGLREEVRASTLEIAPPATPITETEVPALPPLSVVRKDREPTQASALRHRAPTQRVSQRLRFLVDEAAVQVPEPTAKVRLPEAEPARRPRLGPVAWALIAFVLVLPLAVYRYARGSSPTPAAIAAPTAAVCCGQAACAPQPPPHE